MSKFSQKIYKLLKKVPRSKITTYKALAHALGTKAYQAVGQTMRKNPYAPAVPCHRVVASNGTLGGFAGKRKGKEIERKKQMLEKEGIKLQKTLSGRYRIKNFQKVLFKF